MRQHWFRIASKNKFLNFSELKNVFKSVDNGVTPFTPI